MRNYLFVFLFLFLAGRLFAQTADMTIPEQAQFLKDSLGSTRVPVYYVNTPTTLIGKAYTFKMSDTRQCNMSVANGIVVIASTTHFFSAASVRDLNEEFTLGVGQLNAWFGKTGEITHDRFGARGCVWELGKFQVHYYEATHDGGTGRSYEHIFLLLMAVLNEF